MLNIIGQGHRAIECIVRPLPPVFELDTGVLSGARPAIQRAPVPGIQRNADQEAAISGGHVDMLDMRVTHAFAMGL
ncbi:hypothetical protein [Burkholderia sp. Bp9099]|uniref:hypothetical protein n=1 Tax=Burkholderia sp. Bp9099 TaxID=2184568 RepID=UPI0016399B97